MGIYIRTLLPFGRLAGVGFCLFFMGCTQAPPDVAFGLEEPDHPTQAVWLKEFTETKAKGFHPVHSRNGQQCTRASLAGLWRRDDPAEGTTEWTLGTMGQIVCRGRGCRTDGALPRRYAMREVFLNTPRTNVGLLIISSKDTVSLSTCEIEDDILFLGNENGNVTRFFRPKPA